MYCKFIILSCHSSHYMFMRRQVHDSRVQEGARKHTHTHTHTHTGSRGGHRRCWGSSHLQQWMEHVSIAANLTFWVVVSFSSVSSNERVGIYFFNFSHLIFLIRFQLALDISSGTSFLFHPTLYFYTEASISLPSKFFFLFFISFRFTNTTF